MIMSRKRWLYLLDARPRAIRSGKKLAAPDAADKKFEAWLEKMMVRASAKNQNAVVRTNGRIMKLKTASGAIFGSILLLCLSLCASFAQTEKSSAAGSGKVGAPEVAVARVWHGRTKAAQADEYYTYLVEAGIKKIQAIDGNLGVQVFRRTANDVTEFTVISYWSSKEAIRTFAGDDIEKTHSLPKDPEYLLEIEPTVAHYEVMLNEWKH